MAMIRINRNAARNFAIHAREQIQHGALEDVLRHLLSAQLPLMFPDNPWWILEHSTGAEQNVHFVNTAGRERNGFVDSLVGKTAIEYEKNLAQRAIFDEGYYQVKEYCAALLNRGIASADIFGVLSDALRWYAYGVTVSQPPLPGCIMGPDNVTLEELDFVDLSDVSDLNIDHFAVFIQKYLGREESRLLRPTSLAMDMGFESIFCRDHIVAFHDIVNTAFTENEQYANMIASLWQSFVAYLGGTAERGFNRAAYTNELYIVSLAKLLCANIFSNAALLSDDDTLLGILDGRFFQEKGLVNLVEYDYFGWLNASPYIQRMLPVARRIQHDLVAYDFSSVEAEDLFGPLVAQLADKDRRIMLGQEYTPQWLAQKIVLHTLRIIPENENPNMVDMCCGSGVFIVEAIKQTMHKYGITAEACSDEQLKLLRGCVVGFDIDPLAVILSKINWALIMREFLPVARGNLTIPIYHADSLFSAAPLTLIDPDYATQAFRMVFDGETVLLPGFLITPECRNLFDLLIQSCYGIATARAHETPSEYSLPQAQTLVERLTRESDTTLERTALIELSEGCMSLIVTLEKLQREGRNGIWSFILGNSYRPGLVAGQFNAIISNPPWMAMSKLADNPYKAVLTARSISYGIKPGGSSHLHTELATVFLLNAVDRYLKDDAVFGCIMPSTLLNGYHHEPFREQRYLSAEHSVSMSVSEIWEVPTDTFKNKSIVLIGCKNRQRTALAFQGRHVYSDKPDETVEYRLIRQGRRTAWTDNPTVTTITDGVIEKIHFLQGADIMPRTLVFHKCVLQQNGKWSVRPIPRQNDELSYLVSGAKIKKHKDFSLNVINIDDQFIYDCFESEHVLPFYLAAPAKTLLPIKRNEGRWEVVDEAELASYGATVSAAFRRIFEETGESARQYFNRINYRNKLSPQTFSAADCDNWLVMVGAGGGYPCATYVPMSSVLRPEKLIIDQTIYWYLAESEDEALYITGLINSQALDKIISDFQPEGAQGRRHVHTLPYNVTPCFDPDNEAHKQVVDKTRALRDHLIAELATPELLPYCSPAFRNLQQRRRQIRASMQQLPEYSEYEDSCRSVYGV